MAGRRKVERTGPGEGSILVQTPVIALIERAGISVEDYIGLVRSGSLDAMRSTESFNSTTEAVATLKRDYGRILPEGLPELEGAVSWRRAPRMWSLDISHTLIDGRIRFWSAVRKGVSQITVEDAMLPDTMAGQAVGRPLCEIVEHPCLADPGIVIVRIDVFKPTRNPHTQTVSPGSVQFQATVPTVSYPDPTFD